MSVLIEMALTFRKYLFVVPFGKIVVILPVIVQAEYPYASADITFVPLGIPTIVGQHRSVGDPDVLPSSTASSMGKFPWIPARL